MNQESTVNGDNRRPKTMAMRRAASNDEADAASGLDCAHGCRKYADDRSGNRQADGIADLWNAYYANRKSNAARRVALDELFLPDARRRGTVLIEQADCASARRGFSRDCR
jgi:hypothetical protein